MALFQTESTPEGGINYKNMAKDQLIMLLQSQKSDIDALDRKLSEYAPLAEEKERLSQQVESLTAENEALKAKVAELENRAVTVDTEVTEPGSIAEMAIRVNGVMEAAQNAADDYLDRIRKMHDTMRQEFDSYELKAKVKADAIIKNANEEAEAIVLKARLEANDIWSTLQGRFNNYVDEKKSE